MSASSLMYRRECEKMGEYRSNRREAIQIITAAMASVSLSGCGRGQPKIAEERGSNTDQPAQKTDAPEPQDPNMTVKFTGSFVWNTIASGNDGPGPRSRHGLVYDQRGGATVLFGGIVWAKPTHLMSDTWELRNERWSRIDTAASPPARHRSAMIYDPHGGVTVLFGGQGSINQMLGDTWTYADGSWRERRILGRQPSPRCGHSLAFDEGLSKTVLFGGIAPGDKASGDTWLFDGGSWRPVVGSSPPARRYAAFAYDPALKGCVLQGGSEDDHGQRGFGDTWLFRDEAWTRMANGFDTEARDDHGIGYHKAAKRLVLLEGLGGKPGMLVREADGWRKVEVAPVAPRHQCSPLAWDDSLNGLVLYGGELRHGGPQYSATRVLRLSAGT
jgi:Galactose oxidase, central domain